MNTKLIVLDWAGTTVDYGCFAPVNAFARAFEQFDISPTVEEIREPMGMLKIDHIRTMLQMPRLKAAWQKLHGAAPDELAVNQVYAVFERCLLQSLADYAAPKPDTLQTVASLRAMGLKIGSTTGYNDQMMRIVAPAAEQQGYAPDAWFSPDSVNGLGRPYPYMIFANMQRFGIESVKQVVKVGDTAADIREGKNAGVISLGVLEGSSALGLTQKEYEAMPLPERENALGKARQILLDAGADDVLLNLAQLPGWLERHN